LYDFSAINYFRTSICHLRRCRWSYGLRRRYAAAWLLGSRVRIPVTAKMFVSCISCVRSGLCDEPITSSEESYQIYVILVGMWTAKVNNEVA
jgi:hypothetical protein